MNSYWYDPEDQERRYHEIWNKGFRWGVFSGVITLLIFVSILDWIVP